MKTPFRNLNFALAALAVIALLTVPPAFAQTPSLTDPTATLAWLKLQAIGVSLVITLIWKYAPMVKDISNKAIPWLSLVGFVIYHLAGQDVASAADATTVAVHRSIFTAIALGALNSGVAKIAWDGWLKPTLGDWLDRQLGRVPQTPHLGTPVVLPAAAVKVGSSAA
ncbi:MAG TPA: hypothetical protein VNF91_09660 [Candidatus Acidoferrum sp.]|nr:hypothetical protein [Candidatus Acidoferrum sp.]